MKITFDPPLDLKTFGRQCRKLAKQNPKMTLRQAMPKIKKLNQKSRRP